VLIFISLGTAVNCLHGKSYRMVILPCQQLWQSAKATLTPLVVQLMADSGSPLIFFYSVNYVKFNWNYISPGDLNYRIFAQ
jgi:hypothetical protein